jgi:hypothetical protein
VKAATAFEKNLNEFTHIKWFREKLRVVDVVRVTGNKALNSFLP